MYAADNARFAAQIGVTDEIFTKPVVTLELPKRAAEKADSAAGFMLAANLLSRIFTKLHLVAPDLPLGQNPWGLKRLSELVAPLSGISEGSVTWGQAEATDIVIGVGAAATISAPHATYFSFSGWDASLEIELDGNLHGPIGALFAACYGTAQAFIYAAQMVGAPYHPIRPFRLSLLTYDDSGPPLPCPASVDVDDCHLVGVGAIGSALVYSLAHFPSVSGLLRPIDNDHVDDTNLQRYVLMRHEDTLPGAGAGKGKAKAQVAHDALAGHAIKVRPSVVSFGDYRATNTEPIQLLLTPVDSEAGRRNLGSYLPRMVLNAATGHTKVTISRHGFADGKACISCLYLPAPEDLTTEKRLAKDLGLSLAEVEKCLADNSPLDGETVKRIERHRGLEVGALAAYIGQPIQSLHQRAVCGEAAISTATGTIVSPLSFISAAAGVMLAAELVKKSVPDLNTHLLDNYFRIDTMMNPNPAVKTVKPQEPTQRCRCWEPDFIDVYRRRFR